MDRTQLTSYNPSSAAYPSRELRLAAEPLTPAEQQVLGLVAGGLFNHEIAARLGIAVGTVKWHLHQVYEKLPARNRTEAVVRARERGLLPALTA